MQRRPAFPHLAADHRSTAAPAAPTVGTGQGRRLHVEAAGSQEVLARRLLQFVPCGRACIAIRT
jgi:hypothetical protein